MQAKHQAQPPLTMPSGCHGTRLVGAISCGRRVGAAGAAAVMAGGWAAGVVAVGVVAGGEGAATAGGMVAGAGDQQLQL